MPPPFASPPPDCHPPPLTLALPSHPPRSSPGVCGVGEKCERPAPPNLRRCGTARRSSPRPPTRGCEQRLFTPLRCEQARRSPRPSARPRRLRRWRGRGRCQPPSQGRTLAPTWRCTTSAASAAPAAEALLTRGAACEQVTLHHEHRKSVGKEPGRRKSWSKKNGPARAIKTDADAEVAVGAARSSSIASSSEPSRNLLGTF